MILSYSDPLFPPKIKAGIKIHTIREDQYERWKIGMTIHHWMYSPRHVKLKPYPFCKDRDTLKSKQIVVIDYATGTVWIDGNMLNEKGIKLLAKNDGFQNVESFWQWFKKPTAGKNAGLGEPFTGWILHWTDLKY